MESSNISTRQSNKMKSSTKSNLKNNSEMSNQNIEVKLKLDVDTKIEAFMKEMDCRVSEFHNFINSEISKFKAFIVQDFNSKFDALSQKVDKLEEKLSSLQDKESFTKDFNDRRLKLLINGIPTAVDDHNEAIIEKISRFVGFERSPQTSSFRAKKLNGTDDAINVKFGSELDKEVFFNNYRRVAKKLTAEKIFDLPGNNRRIYIQHDMSKQQYQISKEAMRLLRLQQIKKMKLVYNGFQITFNNGKKSTVCSIKSLNHEIIVNKN